MEVVAGAPAPSRFVQAWEVATAEVARHQPDAELSLLVVPNMSRQPGEADWILVAYQERGDTFGTQCDHLMAHLVSEPVPPPWVAHVAPAFELVVPASEPPSMRDLVLQERYEAGDPAVREILAVTVATPDSLVMQAFSMPLLEPLAEPTVNGDSGGLIPDTLRLMVTVLHREG